MARKRRLAPPQVVADNYLPPAHNTSMINSQSSRPLLFPVPYSLFFSHPHPLFTVKL